MYDVIVVGARCSGSATALNLARKGARVLVVDRTSFPSDALSTHFLWPRGLSYLNRWGVLDRVLAQTPSGKQFDFARDGIEFSCETPVESVRARLEAVHGSGEGALGTYASVRRLVLDKLLVDAAVEAGVEFRPHFPVEGLLWEDGRVVGIKAHLTDGTKVEERARFVIGADGRNSSVGKWVDAAVSDVDSECTFAYWTYFSGFSVPAAKMEKRGRLALVVVPTNFNANMTLVFGPKEWLPLFKKNHQENYFRAASFVNPGLGETLRTSGKQEEKLYGVVDQKAFKRRAAGPGWLLVGDAACTKDQCTAIGMTHAFRDAELAAETIHLALAGQDEAKLGDSYCQRRDQDLDGYYQWVGRQAKMAAATEDDLRFMSVLKNQQAWANAFAGMYGDALPISAFLSDIRPRVLEVAPKGAPVPLLGPEALGSAIF